MSGPAWAWLIVGLSIAGVIIRPFKWPEAIWACAGAALLWVCGALPGGAVVAAIAKGGDVYAFLAGMMLLSEAARREGLFDWVAVVAVNHANGSPRRLFVLVYIAAVIVTTFLSNDATAVVLTPAVLAVAKRAKAEPLPLLLICAFVANAASFVLPVSNPANLVLFGDHMPALGPWLHRFGLASLVAIAATFISLYAVQRQRLRGTCAPCVELPDLSTDAKVALGGVIATAVVLMGASAANVPLGVPTALMGAIVAIAVGARKRGRLRELWAGVSWVTLALVAGLFVLVEALARMGAVQQLVDGITAVQARWGASVAAWVAGVAVALGGNVANNLPVGLVASAGVAQAAAASPMVNAVLVGLDLGPNLSVTGSLATILWLAALRREGQDIGFWAFLRVGVAVMFPALLAALACVVR